MPFLRVVVPDPGDGRHRVAAQVPAPRGSPAGLTAFTGRTAPGQPAVAPGRPSLRPVAGPPRRVPVGTLEAEGMSRRPGALPAPAAQHDVRRRQCADLDRIGGARPPLRPTTWPGSSASRTRRSRSTAGSRTASPATPTAGPGTTPTSASSPTGWPTSGKGTSITWSSRRQLAPTDMVNFGGRFDILFGNDWQFTKSYGLFDRAFKPNSFAGRRPAADVRRGPPADPDQERPRHPGRPVLLARRVRERPGDQAAVALGPLPVQLSPRSPSSAS